MEIANNLSMVQTSIQNLSLKYQREPGSVKLLAVSKRFSNECILQAYEAGQRSFGENYVQELVQKAQSLQSYGIDWHFIGPIQSNKTKDIAEHASWVHSIDRLKIAERLSMQRPSHLPPLQVCIQVNVSNEDSKSGVHVSEAVNLALLVNALPNLKLRGLMCIPEASEVLEEQRKPFVLLYKLQQEIKTRGIILDTLSMGMSGDMEAAISEGSTMVRIGTAIFGSRA